MKTVRRRPSALLLGDLSHSDFSDVTSWLAIQCDTLPLSSLIKTPVDLALFFQARPGQVAQQALEEVHQAWPMANLAMVLGSWCEGETRTGQPCHGVRRMFWYEARQLLATSFRTLGPAHRTCTPVEQVARTAHVSQRCYPGRRAVVVAKSRSAFGPLADVLQQMGFEVSWSRQVELVSDSADVIVWDLDDLQPPHVKAAAKRASSSTSSTRWIALMNFPRTSEIQELKSAGFLDVLGKPIALAALEASLAEFLQPFADRVGVA